MRFFLPLLLILAMSACGTVRPVLEQDSTKVEVRVEEKFVHDTAWLEIPVIVEKVATLDTASVLENRYARSEASVSAGVLRHSLATKPVKEPVVVEVREVVRDSIVWRDRVQTETVEVEKALTPWETLKMKTGGLFIGVSLACIFLIILYFLFNPKFFKL